MITNNNSALTQELREVLKIQGGKDIIPGLAENRIVPVINVNPKHARVADYFASGVCANATSATIATLPTDRDVYICAASVSYVRDATATAVSLGLTVVVNGAEVYLIIIPGVTLNAGSGETSICLPFPIKPDRGSLVRIRNSTNVANINTSGVIIGYLDQQSKA